MTYMSRSGAEFWWKQKPPKNVHHYYKEHLEDWKTVTWQDIFAERTATQEGKLYSKRFSPVTVPCFVWVFHNNTTFFGGWWLYIKTLKEDYALNFRQPHWDLVQKVMDLYPCGVLASLDNFDQWAESFSKEFAHQGLGRKKKQGLAKCYCTIDGKQIEDIFITRSLSSPATAEP